MMGRTNSATWKENLTQFEHWSLMILKRSDLGWFGLLMSGLIHIQIYVLLFVMMWCAWHVKVIGKKIAALKEQESGDYAGVELNSTSLSIQESRDQGSLLVEDRIPNE